MSRFICLPMFSISTILFMVSLSVLTVNISKGETSNISGYVIDARTGRPIQGALVSLNSERHITTDSKGYFSFEVTPEGWCKVCAFYDDADTMGVDYVPSSWRMYMEKGTNAYKVLSLWPGASIEIEGQIRFVERSVPASWFKFKVQPPGGTVWGDSYSVSEYGPIDSSEELGLDPHLIIVPADIYVAISVETWVLDNLYRVFTIQNETEHFNMRQGDHRIINVERHCLRLNIESVQEALNLSLALLQRVESVGFLVKAEQKDVLRALTLLNTSEAATAKGSYDEAFALLRNAHISVEDVVNRLQGLLSISLPSALTLTLFFSFISLALTYLLVERGTGLEISSSLMGQHSITIPLRALNALLSYVLILSIFFASFPGCRLVSFPVFFLAASFSLTIASLVVVGSRMLERKKPQDRSIAFGSAIVAAFSISSGNLRKRKLRTTLDILCLMTLVSGFIVFTSISPGYGFISKTLGPSKMSLDALMVANPSLTVETKFIPLPEDFITQMENHPDVTLVAPKAENLPSLASLSRLYAPSGKNSSIHGVIGIVPGVESEITRLNTTIIEGECLSEDGVDELLISESLARHLEIGVKGLVTIFGRNYTVAGIFDDRPLERIREMNDELFLPSRLQATPGGVYLTQCWSDQIVITDLKTALTFPNVAISRAYVQMRNTEELSDQADIIALTRGYSVWVSFEGTLYQKCVGTYVEEKGMSLTPFLALLGILIIGSTMYRSVEERRRSIFTLSSIGLNPTHIAALFMAESIVIGLIAGGLGYFLGVLGYRTIGLVSDLGVREKVSAEWSLIALLFSTLTAVLATVVPAVKASTIVTPSHLRRWRPEEEEKPREEGKPWTVELPVKIRPREVDFFSAHIEKSLRELAGGSIERVEKVGTSDEETVNRCVKKITFDYVTGETRRQLHTSNELIIERPASEKYYKARLLSSPDRNFEEAVLKTSTLIRRFIFEWNAQKVAVVTPFESSLNQLYSLVYYYNPESLYVVAETDVSDQIKPLKRILEKEGIRVPRIFTIQMNSLDLADCVKMAEDLVLRAGIVCVSGDSAPVCVALTLAATKLKKKMCHVVPSGHQVEEPFQVSKVVAVG